MNIALLGLGKMGLELAPHLLRGGHQLTVWNRTASRADDLVAQGATLAPTPCEAAATADLVLNIVFDDTSFEAVTFGPDGVLAGLPPHAIHASLSTISVDLARRLAAAHAAAHRTYVGAPVLGLPPVARAAKLLFILGGDPAVLARMEPIVDLLGRAAFLAGTEPWQAHLFKLTSNFMISSMIQSFAEAQALLLKSGSDPAEFVRLQTELWGSPLYTNYGNRIATGAFDPPGGTLALGLKDNRFLLDAARDLTVPLPTASLIRDQMLASLAAGNAERDWTSLSETAFRNAGLTPPKP